ncbi:penicillin-binding protein 2 [Catalinimonas alkaloidigena]|uniref:Penicillin-binding protein 2 n=1 Tax=Catalinimonas alkaloidigena TaxID=1075417 RepID=A0A1G9MZE0_9BACT|nr:penicillin-binding protein 2 [Catalinimonas alkaloidigena]SDL79513.1 penicillin-binding protein 2 [Catalinimonas alkaloidigena]
MIENRKYIVILAFLLIGMVYAAKLFMLQVVDDTYKRRADNNAVKRVMEYPYRGVIYDRNGAKLVYNEPVYDIMVTPREVHLDDTLAFCRLMHLTKEEVITKLAEAKDYSYRKPSAFLKQVSGADFARIQDQLIEFPGFEVVPRTVRGYPHKSFANALGYIGEISPSQLEKMGKDQYSAGDYIGISGLEYQYERFLRGKRGVKYIMVDRHGINKGAFKDGKYDTTAVKGENLVCTIDLNLQQYGERLMNGKIGSIVAIEPATGEILSLVSGPSYDPNILRGREFGKNFSVLQKDSLVPLFNRGIQAMYPPGSTFKLIEALIALQEGVIHPETHIACNRAIINCHGPHSFPDLRSAITNSCNPYFVNTFKRIINQEVNPNTFIDSRIGLTKWREYQLRFGLGRQLGLDIPNEKGGFIPSPEYYDRYYGEGHWKHSTIYSLGIGQGEILVTPLQMANLAATIANRGYYVTPHLIKSIGESGQPLLEYQQKNFVGVEARHFETVVEGMADVVDHGTGQYRAKIPGLQVCGKTGTVQNPHGEDHSGFIAFAPKDNPKIAVAVYVENAGQGARAAASIASLVIEKYMLGEIKRKNIEDYALKGKFVY